MRFGWMRIVSVLLLLGLVVLPAQAQEQTVDEQVDAVFRSMKTVGGAFVIAKDGQIVYERYYGVQQKSTNVPVTQRSYFRCASVTKLVTGIGILRLIERGVLSPDEDISTYLGYTVRNPRYMETPITLRMLMSHTAGMNETSSYSSQSSLLRDMIDVERKAKANFRDVKPGQTYSYSNFGAGITGSIIECVTGVDVSSYMRQDLFLPLGIDAAYKVNQLGEPEYICATYDQDGHTVASASYLLKQPYIAEPSPDTHYRMTVGGLYIRPRDLARLGIALCGDGTLDGQQVLSAESLAMMRQEQSPQTTGITSDSPYSFFTIRQDTLFEGRRVYGHQGTSDGIVCNLYYEPQSKLVLVVVSNGCDSPREDGIMRITRRLAQIVQDQYLTGDVAVPVMQAEYNNENPLVQATRNTKKEDILVF